MRATCLAPLEALVLAGLVSVARSQSPVGQTAEPARAEILVLGVYHMANPGHDIFNTQADDVLAPRRQAEMAQLIEVLKKFQPTRIAVERNAGDQGIARDYGDYLAGKHQLTRNEIEQIGFRLAKALGHQTVYPVDADGEFPYAGVVDYAKAHGLTKDLDEITGESGGLVKAQNAYLASHTILETLLYMNADQQVADAMRFYYRVAGFGEPWNWPGPDLVSDWYRRNMRIFGNILQLANASSERVLVVFGAGHLGWLRQDIAGDPALRLRKLAEFVN